MNYALRDDKINRRQVSIVEARIKETVKRNCVEPRGFDNPALKLRSTAAAKFNSIGLIARLIVVTDIKCRQK